MNKFQKFPNAITNIRDENPCSNLCGQIKFYQKQNCVIISININGLPSTSSGFFGFHIHEGDSCKGVNFSETDNHYNPTDTPYPLHAGDLPPLMFCNGSACQTVATDRFKVKDITERSHREKMVFLVNLLHRFG